MPGARCTGGLVCKKSGETHTSIQGSGEHPTFPAQWFDGLCRALPGDEFVLPPSPADWRIVRTRLGRRSSAGLTPATGARTTRFCRTQPPGFRRVGAGRLRAALAHGRQARPATTTRARRCRVHRNPPLVRDDGQRPSGWDGMGEGCIGDLGVASRKNSV